MACWLGDEGKRGAAGVGAIERGASKDVRATV